MSSDCQNPVDALRARAADSHDQRAEKLLPCHGDVWLACGHAEIGYCRNCSQRPALAAEFRADADAAEQRERAAFEAGYSGPMIPIERAWSAYQARKGAGGG